MRDDCADRRLQSSQVVVKLGARPRFRTLGEYGAEVTTHGGEIQPVGEMRSGAGQDDRTDVVVTVELRKDLRQLTPEIRSHRIALAWPGEYDLGDVVGNRHLERFPLLLIAHSEKATGPHLRLCRVSWDRCAQSASTCGRISVVRPILEEFSVNLR